MALQNGVASPEAGLAVSCKVRRTRDSAGPPPGTYPRNENRVARDPALAHRMDRILANHIADKRLVSRIYKKLLQVYSKKTNNARKNGQSLGAEREA